MNKYIILFCILSFINVAYSQSEDDNMDFSRIKYDECLRKNITSLFDDSKIVLENSNNNLTINNFLTTKLSKAYKSEIHELLKIAVEKTYLNSKKVYKRSRDKRIISHHLEYLFMSFFAQEYQRFYGLKRCYSSAIDIEGNAVDLNLLLEPTWLIINKYKKSLGDYGKNECLNITRSQFFFRLAILLYKPELSEYVEARLQHEVNKLVQNDGIDIASFEFLWEILEI